LNSAKIYDHARNGAKYGVTAENARIDQTAVVARKNKVVKTLVSGVGAAMKAAKVEVKTGLGEIVGRDAEGVVRVKVGDETFEGRRLIVATGSEAVVPPIPGVKEGMAQGTVLTNREILDLQSIPKTLVVVGGGVIGLEMAGYFQTCGSQVTVIEMLDHIAGAADREMAALLQKAFEKQGVKFHLNAKVTSVGDGFVEFEEGGATKRADAERVGRNGTGAQGGGVRANGKESGTYAAHKSGAQQFP
ncbi:MAG: dihydrolipoyl dehydrogenase, partial [Clostridia bacterium]|nr:dihydrolipoyl dehydrogenase [Clostridia bacterium]